MLNNIPNMRLLELSLLLDEETRNHCRRVRKIAVQIGKLMGLPHVELIRLGLAAQFHDLGKIAIDPHILNHRGRLSNYQWQQIIKHPEIGADLWHSFSNDHAVARAILCHHERYDGGGYPSGLTGTQIPLWSRIIAVADALDAMVSHRPYRKALDFHAASLSLLQASGSQFDPIIIHKIFMPRQRIKPLAALRA